MLTLLRRPPPAPTPRRDWYRDADPEDRREYDAFGPWVTEVTAEADMPKRFRFAWPRLAEALLILKVPCGAERVNMRPGMDLYVGVLAIHAEGVTLMRWTGAEVTTREIGWTEIAFLRNETNLLAGHWTLMTLDGDRETLDYSTVSARVLDKASALIRARCAWEDAPDTRPPPGEAVGITDHIYRYMATSMTRVGPQPAVPVHFEPQGRWCRSDRNRRRQATGLLILDAPAEFIVIGRNEPVKSLFTPNYSVVSLFVPIRRLDGVTVTPAPEGKAVRFHHLVLEAGRQKADVACLTSPEAVIALLRARGVAVH